MVAQVADGIRGGYVASITKHWNTNKQNLFGDSSCLRAPFRLYRFCSVKLMRLGCCDSLVNSGAHVKLLFLATAGRGRAEPKAGKKRLPQVQFNGKWFLDDERVPTLWVSTHEFDIGARIGA